MDNMWTPRVSIIIPVYNGVNYMREAIDSALSQTYENVEIIVVNDGSTDGGETEKVALTYGDKIRYFRKENGGVSSALNFGIKNMTGEYFSWLSHDDVYTADKISHQIESLRRWGDESSVALCAHCFINERSERLNKAAPNRFTDGRHEWTSVLGEILDNGAFSGCALLIPIEAIKKCGGFHEGLRFSQDALLWMQIFCEKYSLVYNGDEDVFSRIHGKQLTQTGRSLFRKDSLSIAEIMIPRLSSISDRKNNYLLAYARRSAGYGNKEVVDACIAEGKGKDLFAIGTGLGLRMKLICSQFRPFFRKMYYRFLVREKASGKK